MFGIQKFYFLLTQCIYVFGTYLIIKSDYFPIQRLLIIFLSERERVYCAVRDESLNVVHVILRL